MSITIYYFFQIVEYFYKFMFIRKEIKAMELPEVTFFDDFYFWFNTETKTEYYATPLYFYKADYHLDTENKLRDVYYKETEITDNGLKHPASIYFPFHEKFGLLLLRFLPLQHFFFFFSVVSVVFQSCQQQF